MLQEEEKEMSLEERQAQPLWKKIDNVLPNLLANCTNNYFKEKWHWPGIDPETGLFLVKKPKQPKKAPLNSTLNKSQRPLQIPGKAGTESARESPARGLEQISQSSGMTQR